ncbi:PQQ-binding-like beta-propeller repeat protein [Actinoplanes sp. NPDC026670]|uniref:outer membrane protein assembly factor BamB family protein n=1 Tax=Actinoplanes sp. NPDC026670 TaxID=3154700 RepID=UPI0033D56AC3
MIDLDRAVPPARPAPPVTRALPAALVVVLLAFLLGPSAPMPRVRELAQVAATASPSGTWLLTGTTLYSTHTRTTGRLEVIAWSLDSGTAIWQRDVDWFAGIPALTEIGPALVVSGNDDTRILDVRTGADRVDPRTYSLARAAGDRIALWDGAAGTLALYDPKQDRIRWKQPFSARPHAIAATSAHLLAVTDSSTTTLALDNGDLVHSTDRVAAAGSTPTVRVIDDRAYLLGDSTVTMIDGRRTWTLPLLLPRAITACGTLVCVSGGPGLSAIELLNGHVVWNNRNWIGGEGGIVRTADGRALLIDPGTGVARRDLGYGLPAGDLLIRPDGPGLSVVEWAAGQVRGHLPGSTPSGCRRTGRHLACQQTGGQVKVWRLL